MTPDSASAANPIVQLIPFAIMGLIFYYIVFQPEKKRQAKHKEKLSKLQKNDQVVTSGGIHGTIVNVKTDTVIVRIDDNVKIEVDREAITSVKTSNQ